VGCRVSMPSVEEAIRRYPCLADLVALFARQPGWVFLPLGVTDDDVLYGVREGSVVTDTLIICAEWDTTVARLRTEEVRDPFRAMRGAVLWSFTGSLTDAIGELLALPDAGM
jgi:hypothetical protein